MQPRGGRGLEPAPAGDRCKERKDLHEIILNNNILIKPDLSMARTGHESARAGGRRWWRGRSRWRWTSHICNSWSMGNEHKMGKIWASAQTFAWATEMRMPRPASRGEKVDRECEAAVEGQEKVCHLGIFRWISKVRHLMGGKQGSCEYLTNHHFFFGPIWRGVVITNQPKGISLK